MRYCLKGVVGELSSFPNCSQIAVSHSVFVGRNDRGKGLGTIAGLERRKLIAELGYDMMLCTVDASNSAQIAVLGKTGWHQLTSFISTKTGHTVELWCCTPIRA